MEKQKKKRGPKPGSPKIPGSGRKAGNAGERLFLTIPKRTWDKMCDQPLDAKTFVLAAIEEKLGG